MHTLVVLNFWATVTVVALFQAVIEQAQVFLHLLGLVYRVRIQDLWDQAQRAMKRYRVTSRQGLCRLPPSSAAALTSGSQI